MIPKRSGHSWDSTEITLVTMMHEQGCTSVAIGNKIERTSNAVRRKLYSLGYNVDFDVPNEVNSSKGFYVIGLGQSAPSKVHECEAWAEREAERLARANPGVEFVVAEIKGSVKAKVETTLERK